MDKDGALAHEAQKAQVGKRGEAGQYAGHFLGIGCPVMQRVGHAPAINRQVGGRCLVQDVPVGRCEEGEQFGQQDVLGAELQTAGDGLVQGGGG